MLVGGGTDQLHIHVHGVGDFLHAAFDDIGDAELLTDFAQVVRRAFVLLSRGSGDHLQVGNLREASEDFVLNPFGEIGVALSSLRFSNGNTAIDFCGTIEAVAASVRATLAVFRAV